MAAGRRELQRAGLSEEAIAALKNPDADLLAYHVPVVVMHIKGTPKNMQMNPAYEDLIQEIMATLQESIQIAVDAMKDSLKIPTS